MDGIAALQDGAKPTVCVTGATGYIGSWLVRSLLRKGYAVRATARDTAKASSYLSEWGAADGQLEIFRADLGEEGSFDEAVKGCIGVFHVAASMVFQPLVEGDVEEYVKSNILEPGVRGTINVLQACWRAGSVKRVIFTSSISTVTAKDEKGQWKSVVDESCVNPIDVVMNTKPTGWVYALSKIITEENAFRFAREKGIDLVSIIPPTVAGPFFTQSIPSSVQVLLSPITGNPMLYPVLVAVHSRLGSISLAHIEDICNAHIFLMEAEAANGRYICAVGSCVMSQLTDLLSNECSSFITERNTKEFSDIVPSVLCSKRLTELGFRFQYNISDIIRETVACCSYLQLSCIK